MWDLPRPGPEPVSPALAGGFLTTVPPEKSFSSLFTLPSLSVCRDSAVMVSAQRTLEAKKGTGSCLHFGDLVGYEGSQVWLFLLLSTSGPAL